MSHGIIAATSHSSFIGMFYLIMFYIVRLLFFIHKIYEVGAECRSVSQWFGSILDGWMSVELYLFHFRISIFRKFQGKATVIKIWWFICAIVTLDMNLINRLLWQFPKVANNDITYAYSYNTFPLTLNLSYSYQKFPHTSHNLTQCDQVPNSF